MKKIYTIGRDEGCDIIIPDNTDVISRLHATLRVESNDKIFLIDQSRNGTYVNGMKMSSNVEIPISRKDVVSFAHIYNLDWSLVPKQKGNLLKSILIIFVSMSLLTGIAYALMRHFNNPNCPATPIESQKLPSNTPINDNPTLTDTVVVRDTVVVSVDERPINVIPKDTISVEDTEEEIYNPIY